jgi:hypothetical protein
MQSFRYDQLSQYFISLIKKSTAEISVAKLALVGFKAPSI